MSAPKTIGRHISVEEFDRMFEAGEDVSEYVDWANAKRPNIAARRGA